MIGYCRFCGQSRMVDGDPTMSEEELNQLATSICECSGATHEAWKNSTMEVYDQDLEVLFGKRPEIKKLMHYAGEQILDGKMISLSIKQSGEKSIGLRLKDMGLQVKISNKTTMENISHG